MSPVFEKDAPQSQLRLYRNRVRLLATESTYVAHWLGYCEGSDLIEADGEFDVTLTVTPVPDVDTSARPPDAHSPNTRNDDAGTPASD